MDKAGGGFSSSNSFYPYLFTPPALPNEADNAQTIR